MPPTRNFADAKEEFATYLCIDGSFPFCVLPVSSGPHAGVVEGFGARGLFYRAYRRTLRGPIETQLAPGFPLVCAANEIQVGAINRVNSVLTCRRENTALLCSLFHFSSLPFLFPRFCSLRTRERDLRLSCGRLEYRVDRNIPGI